MIIVLHSPYVVVIVFHSLLGIVETGLPRLPSREKGGKARPRGSGVRYLSVTGSTARSSAFRGMQPILSATQTAWRRERDSNPRYGFPHCGFQDVPFLSVLSRVNQLRSEEGTPLRGQGPHSALIVLRFVLYQVAEAPRSAKELNMRK
jgi:hypothetical protein